MPKTSYKPTPTDAATGARIRQLRKMAGETLNQAVERSGVSFGFGTLCRIENGARHISIPDATKLAAHFNTTVDKILINPAPVETEQAWLGNEPTPLFPIPAAVPYPVDYTVPENGIIIDRDNPMTPDEYRDQVWIPYLEHRYTTDRKTA